MNEAWDQNNPAEQPQQAPPTHTPPASPFPPPPLPPTHHSHPINLSPQSTWPKVFSILSIVFGSLGILNAGCNIITIPLSLGILSIASQQSAAVPTFTPWQIAYSIGAPVIAMAFSVLLLIAGIFLLQRKPLSVTLHKVWAMTWLPTAILLAAVNFLIQHTSLNQPASQSASPIPNSVALMLAIPIAILSLMLMCAYPIIVSIWFNRPAIKREYRTWKQQHPSF